MMLISASLVVLVIILGSGKDKVGNISKSCNTHEEHNSPITIREGRVSDKCFATKPINGTELRYPPSDQSVIAVLNQSLSDCYSRNVSVSLDLDKGYPPQKQSYTACCVQREGRKMHCYSTVPRFQCEEMKRFTSTPISPIATYLGIASSTNLRAYCKAILHEGQDIVFMLLAGESTIQGSYSARDTGDIVKLVEDREIGTGTCKTKMYKAYLSLPMTQGDDGRRLICCAGNYQQGTGQCKTSKPIFVFCAPPTERPTIDFDARASLSRVTSGKAVRITCTASVTQDDTLQFTASLYRRSQGWENSTYSLNASEVEVLTNQLASKDNCTHKIVSARLTLVLSENVRRLRVACCPGSAHSQDGCASIHKINVKCPPLKHPQNKLTNLKTVDLVEGDQLKSECSVDLNQTTQFLFKLKHKYSQGYTTFSPRDKIVEILKNETEDTNGCPVTHVKAILTLNVTARMYSHTLSCCRTDLDWRYADCTTDPTFHVRCPKSGPWNFSLKLDSVTRSLMAEGILITECQAYLDAASVVRFRVINKNETKIYRLGDKEVTLLKVEDPISSACKLNKMTVLLNARVTDQFIGQNVSCCVYDGTGREQCSSSSTVASGKAESIKMTTGGGFKITLPVIVALIELALATIIFVIILAKINPEKKIQKRPHHSSESSRQSTHTQRKPTRQVPVSNSGTDSGVASDQGTDAFSNNTSTETLAISVEHSV